jgi:MFS family permease
MCFFRLTRAASRRIGLAAGVCRFPWKPAGESPCPKELPMALAPNAKVFYGWKLSFLGALGNFMIQGSAVYLLNAFIEPFSDLYGWSRSQMGTAQAIGSFFGMAATPFFAWLAMKVPLRLIMALGALFGGISLTLLGRFSSLTLFTVNFCVLWIAGQACGGPIANALMSNWFIKYRGRAFGIVNFGMSFSGAVLPFTALILIKFFSVQTASVALGVFLLVVLFPATWLFVRDTPESMGMKPDGADPGDGEASAKEGAAGTGAPQAPEQAPPTVLQLFRDPLLYRIAIPFAIALIAAAGVVGQLKPRFSDLGFIDYWAMAFMCMTAFFTATGKYLWGWICDTIPPLLTSKIFFLYCAVAFMLAFLPPNLFTAFIFSLLCGLGLGGAWTLLPAVVADVFGRSNFLAAYRVIALFLFLKSVGYLITGQTHRLTGSYEAAFIVFSCLCLVGFVLIPRTGTKYVAKSGSGAEPAAG